MNPPDLFVCLRCYSGFRRSSLTKKTGAVVSIVFGLVLGVGLLLLLIGSMTGADTAMKVQQPATVLLGIGMIGVIGGLVLLFQKQSSCPGCGSGDVIHHSLPRALEIADKVKRLDVA